MTVVDCIHNKNLHPDFLGDVKNIELNGLVWKFLRTLRMGTKLSDLADIGGTRYVAFFMNYMSTNKRKFFEDNPCATCLSTHSSPEKSASLTSSYKQ